MNHIWDKLTKEAQQISHQEPILSDYLNDCILIHDSIYHALSYILSKKLANETHQKKELYQLFLDTYQSDPLLGSYAIKDVKAIMERDPAIKESITAFLYLKGFHAIQIHRLANKLWHNNREALSLYIQHRNSIVNGVDIHPAASIGKRIMFDHATGIVIGETAIIEDNVSILQGVTLGGTGKDCGDRHPKIRKNVMIGSGAKILGNIEIGEGAKVGAGSVVLNNVSPHTTVAGVPAIIIGKTKSNKPSKEMNQNILDDLEKGHQLLGPFFFHGEGI